MTVPTIDTHEFTRRSDVAQGREPLGALERLGSLLAARDGVIDWRLSGRSDTGADGSPRVLLHLALSLTAAMRCVRCLERLDVSLAIERDYRLVATEAQAEQEDVDDDDVDLLVGGRRFDLAGLIEDEAIMALPPAPRHDGCSVPSVTGDAAANTEAEPAPPSRHPFASLGLLRGLASGQAFDAPSGPVDEPGAPPPGRPRQG
jgi:uncharacterized protein